MAKVLDLPPELRILADFFETDDRPTAILTDDYDADTEKYDLLYHNPAFERLHKRDEEVKKILKKITSTHKACNGASTTESWNVVLDGSSWSLRTLKHGCSVLIRTGRPATSSEGDSPVSAENGTVNGNGIVQPKDNAAPLDWTRHPVADLPPWIEHIRTFDWGSTPLGPMEHWPQLLRGSVMHINRNPSPRLIVWGESRTFIYNEACIPLFLDKHPNCLGHSVREVWAEAYNDIGPIIEAGFEGKVTRIERMHLTVRRSGFLEETYWDFTLLPILGPEGSVIGLIDELTESTRLEFGDRRRAALTNLSQHLGDSDSLQELFPRYFDGLEGAAEDVPFALLYEVVDGTLSGNHDSLHTDSESIPKKKCVLRGSRGISGDGESVHKSFTLSEDVAGQDGIIKPCIEALNSRKSLMLSIEDGTLAEPLLSAIAGRAPGEEIRTATMYPITSFGGNEVLAILVTGFNPKRPLDDEYKLYSYVMADMLIKSASVISLPLEQRRQRKIADDMNTALAHQLRIMTLEHERMEAKFGRMAQEAPTGMFVFDPEGRPLFVNQAYLNMLGETKESHAISSPKAMAWRDHVHPDDLLRFVRAWQRALEQKAPIVIEHRLKKPWTSHDKASGQEISGERWLLANAFPDVDPDGKVSSIQGWLTDISHRKFTESLLARKLEDALENKRQTENFIDMTSHEMRNPLSAILQSADSIATVLSSGTDVRTNLPHDVAEEIIDAAQTIILCAQHQKRIVDDILTLSKLDASLLVISPDRVQPPALVHKALKMYEAEMARADITANVEIEETYEDLGVDWVVLDPSRLLQVVINLLTNSIKFTQCCDERKITICLGASLERPTGRHHHVDFIPPKHTRAAHSPLSEWGDGENLYLQIAVRDSGKGLSDDEIQVLFQRFSQASPKTYKQYGGSGLGLFISRELCELQGGQIGVSSRPGRTVFTFFVRAKRWVSDASPDKAHRPALPRFTSVSAGPRVLSRRGSTMPSEQGNETYEPLSRVGSLSEQVKPLTKPSSREKPFSKEEPASPGALAESDKEVLHVLIVEDNLINQKVMSQQLRRAGCIVHVANHGLECLSFLERTAFCSAELPLSVILLDLEMPTMDGLTCIKQIREHQVNGKIIRHVPVIAVTANARSEQISVAIEAGMDTVVVKPFRIPELIPQMYHLVADVAQRWESD